jgi:hypothetical protein
MNAIERGLMRPIPLDKAASFFVGLKDFGRVAPADDELMAECVKQAAAESAPQKTPIAEEAPADSAQVDPHPFLNVKSASLRFKLLAGLFKAAADETLPSDDASAATLASPTPAAVPPQEEYLANEEAGMAAEAQNALQYYQAQLEQARASAAAATESATMAQQQVEELTAQQEAHQTQLTAAQQEGQIAQQAALQQVETANQAAVQAMQQSVGASNQALQAKGQEAAAKIEVQSVRSQLFDMAAQGLPGTEPELGGAGGAAEGMEPLAPQEAGAEGAEGVPAEEGGEAAADDGAAAAEGGEEGAEEAPADGSGAPDAGLEQGATASSDGIAEQEEDPSAAAPAEASPMEAAPGGDAASAGPQSAPGSEGAPPKKPPGQISIKVGTAQERRAKIAAALPELFTKTAGLGAAGIGALAGGALGAGAAGLEASGHGHDLGKMREGIEQRDAAPKRSGIRGFADALALVQDKARLGLGEATRAHPIPATITGGIAGAAMGASAGPRIADLVREAASLHRGA